jgi:hypothetical protein
MKLTRKIDFFIVGAQKAGTSSLYQFLRQHKAIYLPTGKDFFAFNEDPMYGVPESKLGVYYRNYAGQPLVGGSNVQIMAFPGAVESLHSYSPEIRLIIMLRNPLERAYSAYWMMRRSGRERCETFEAALAEEGGRLERGTFRDKAEFSYLAHGYYHDQIKFIYRFFDREKVYIGLFDDLKLNPERLTLQVLDHLGVGASDLDIDFSKKANQASMPRSMTLQRINKSQNRFKKLYRTLAPVGLQVRLAEFLFETLEKNNLRPVKYPPMAPETRGELAKHFWAHNEKLSHLIGRDLSHWR